jgi:hypothetical protein
MMARVILSPPLVFRSRHLAQRANADRSQERLKRRRTSAKHTPKETSAPEEGLGTALIAVRSSNCTLNGATPSPSKKSP